MCTTTNLHIPESRGLRGLASLSNDPRQVAAELDEVPQDDTLATWELGEALIDSSQMLLQEARGQHGWTGLQRRTVHELGDELPEHVGIHRRHDGHLRTLGQET
jgi:hypothetical protein